MTPEEQISEAAELACLTWLTEGAPQLSLVMTYELAFKSGAQFGRELERKRILEMLRTFGTTDLLPENLADFLEEKLK